MLKHPYSKIGQRLASYLRASTHKLLNASHFYSYYFCQFVLLLSQHGIQQDLHNETNVHVSPKIDVMRHECNFMVVINKPCVLYIPVMLSVMLFHNMLYLIGRRH